MTNTRTIWSGGVVLSLVCCLCLSASLWAATINVPADYATIQGAIDAASDGDEIVVATGTYVEQLNIASKSITVRSTNPLDPAVVAATIIDGDAKGAVVVIDAADSVLSGFTITNGTGHRTDDEAPPLGGGVFAQDSTFTVSYCNITGNSALSGGGVFTSYSTPTISHNVISGNEVIASFPYTQGMRGGGVCVQKCPTGTINNNLIVDNTSEEIGGGVCLYECSLPLTSNTIADNAADESGGGIATRYGTYSTIKNNIVVGNEVGGGIVDLDNVRRPSGPTILYCNVFGNGENNYLGITDPTGTNGNLSVDPLFADATNGDYRLQSQGGRWNGTAWVMDVATSPCLDAGDPASAFDLEPAPNGGRLNMGYDGNTADASKTALASPAPTVAVWGPKDRPVGVAANINITFSEVMARSSAQNAMRINGVKAATFGGAFTWVGRRMTFNPTNNLLPGTTYKILIGTAARSRAGVNMTKGFAWEFTTKGAPPAAVTVASVPTASGAQIIANLSAAADVTVSVRNLAGREVAVLTPGRLEAGVHSLLWNGKSKTGTKAPAGMYLVQITARSANGASCSAVASLRK